MDNACLSFPIRTCVDEISLILQDALLRFLKEELFMPDFVATILAALIGSVIGSVGAVLADHWLTERSEQFHRREILVQRYLFQMQDALEMLYFRLENLAFRGGKYVMTDEYFEQTTLYALGRTLALERIFALEAVYPQLDTLYPGLGKLLKDSRIDFKLQHSNFYQYDRVALAEAVIEREGDGFRASTYLEFRKRYEAANSLEKQWLMPASRALQTLSISQMEDLLATVKTKALDIAKKTGMDSSLARN